MAISRQTLTELRRLLLDLYANPQDIQRVAEEAGLNIARINMGGSAVNIWHAVLGEAQKIDAIGELVAVVAVEYRKPAGAMASLLGISLPPVEEKSSPTPSTPQTDGGAPTDEASKSSKSPSIQPRPTAPVLPIEHPGSLLLKDRERQLLSTLLRTASRLKILTEFTDGRTATRVFLVCPIDSAGREELPSVIKLGAQSLIDAEWQATQRHVLRQLPGMAAIQGEPIYLAIDGGIWGALRYAQVGDGIYAVQSLAQYLTKASDLNSWYVLEERLFRQLGRLWRSTMEWQPLLVQNSYDIILPVNFTATPVAADNANLCLDGKQIAAATAPLPAVATGAVVELTNFVVTEVELSTNDTFRFTLTLDLPMSPIAVRTAYRVRVTQMEGQRPAVDTVHPPIKIRVTATRQELLTEQVVAHVTDVDLSQPMLLISSNLSQQLPNPLLALADLLAMRHNAKFATIHGDLNLRNILVDIGARSTHIIDCAAARQDHALQDLLRMERDFLTDVLVHIFFQAGLPPTTIVRLYQLVHCASRGAPAASGHFSLPSELPPTLYKPFILLVTIRRAARELLAEPGQWGEYYTGLIIHLVGALKFRDLDTATAGHQPKLLAFWGAAVTLDLLQELQSGQTRTCRDINWRFFDVTKGEPPDVNSKGATPLDLTAAQSLGLENSGLESFTPDATAAPTADDLPPVQRRLDVAAPEQATLGRAFSLAVAVRQLTSPPLQLADLPLTRSGQALLDWPAAERFIRLRAEVIAPECEIVGAASYTFKLYRNLDSELSYFSLIPKVTGRLSIIVRLYQEADMLGSALAHTVVSEQVVGEVGVQLRSEQVTPKVTPRRDNLVVGDAPSVRPIKILFLAANPLDTVFLRTDEEARAIDTALRQAANRNFEIRVHGAVRIDDLQDLLLRHQPDIVHFSGHGTEANELILVDANGNSVRVSGAALRQLFTVLKGNIRCIVLNACYTETQAKALAEVIDCVVGIEDAISDEGARQFATAFYRALGYEKSIGDAFALGQVQIELAGLGEGKALHLLTRTGEAAAVNFGEASNVTAAPTGRSATPSTPAQRTSTPAVDTEFLQSMLAQRQRNLQLLQRQKANFGAGEEPLRLLNQIAAEEEAIAKLQQQLGK